jgi:membrane protein DedA with SNARE-associated domain
MHSILHHLIHDYGLLAVAGFVGLECVGIPMPGETALIGAAIYAGSHHNINIYEVIFTAAAAASIGRMIGFVIGREFGYWLLLRYGFYLRMNEARIKLGQYLFLRHGGKIVLVAQFLPILRTFAGIFAGANRMPWKSFMLANVVGSLAWSVCFGFAAYMLGLQVERLARSIVILLVIATVIVFFIGWLIIRRHEAQLEAEAERALPGPLELP